MMRFLQNKTLQSTGVRKRVFLTTNAEYCRVKLVYYGKSRLYGSIHLFNNFSDIWWLLKEPL